MRVALITDIPFLCEDTMYMQELEKKLIKFDVESTIFLVRSPKSLSVIDSVTGVVRVMTTSSLVRKLVDFDVIHVQFTYPIAFTLTLLSSLRLLKKPIIVHTHGYDVFTVDNINYGLRRNKIGKFITRYTWKRADSILAVCERSRSEILRAGVEKEKLHVLYNGVDEILFDRIESNLPMELLALRDQNDIVLLSVATIVPVKNHSRMIRAFNDFVQKYRSKYKIKLALVGENLLHDSVISEHTDSVIYLGKVSHRNLPFYYSIADAFVLPSLSEAHPWSILEAMSCQVPVIASNVGGIPETIEGPNFLVDPYDISDIARKFENFAEMGAAERRKIGSLNREKVIAKFTLNHHVNELKHIYESHI